MPRLPTRCLLLAQSGAFLQKLQKLGWTEGRNVRMDIRAGAGNLAATRKYAAELVALAPDVIVASDTGFSLRVLTPYAREHSNAATRNLA
jgi:hypothetical protein